VIRATALLALASTAVNAAALDLIGYLPYYRLNSNYLNNVLPGQLSMLDEVRYFGLTVDSNGGIVSQSGTLQSHKNNIAAIQDVINSLPEGSRPRLDITLGGAGEDATFTSVAASESKRTLLAQNVNALLNETGATAVDIDWEHPDAGVQRSTQFPALLKRIKQEVGAGRMVYATVDPTVVISNSVFTGPNAIDGVSLMTYDLGWWGNDPGDPNTGEHSPQEYVADSVEAWTEVPGSANDRPWVFGTWGNGSPAESLGIGLPFYGRALTSQTAYTYSELVAGGTTTDGEYYQYAGQRVWSPSPELAAERVEYAIEQGLQHLIFWEMAQDLPTTNSASLLRAAYETRQALASLPGDYNNDGTVDAADYTVWRDGGSPDSNQTGYDLWVGGYGATSSNAGVNQPIDAVPEPAASVFVYIACFGGIVRTRVGNKRP
jgi:GH18 family chitinase